MAVGLAITAPVPTVPVDGKGHGWHAPLGDARTRGDLAQALKLPYRYQKELWFLAAARGYCMAVGELAAVLARANLGSRGLTAFRDFLAGYAASAVFSTLAAEAAEVDKTPPRRSAPPRRPAGARPALGRCGRVSPS